MILFRVTKNMTKILLWKFKQSLGSFNTLTVHKCSDIGLFRQLSRPPSCSLQYPKQIISRPIFILKVFQILCRFRKCRKKIERICFDLEVITFELVVLNSRFYWETILVIMCQYVKKQSQDLMYY